MLQTIVVTGFIVVLLLALNYFAGKTVANLSLWLGTDKSTIFIWTIFLILGVTGLVFIFASEFCALAVISLITKFDMLSNATKFLVHASSLLGSGFTYAKGYKKATDDFLKQKGINSDSP